MFLIYLYKPMLGYVMKVKSIWTNYKIYAFLFGIITGAVVYNLLGIDFSFTKINRIKGIDFWECFLYLVMINLKFWLLIFVLSFLKIKDKIVLFIIYIESFLLSGFIVIAIGMGNYVLLSEILMTVFKLLSTLFMFRQKQPVLYRMISLVILIMGTLLENIFFVKF